VSKASTISGDCFHFFEASEEGLRCTECGYLLPLVSTWPVPQAIEIVNWHGSAPGFNISGQYIRKTDDKIKGKDDSA